MLMMVMMMMMMMKIRIRNHMLSVESFKDYINFTRVAAYPDVAKFEASREHIEQCWPAYAKDFSLSRPSFFLAPRSVLCLPDAVQCSRDMTLEEQEWTRKYQARLQHVMAHMNHHIHPLVNPSTGERRPLRSCIPKGKKTGCRSNFPLDAEMCEQPMLVCPCIAAKQHLPTSGPRSYIGCVLSARNDHG